MDIKELVQQVNEGNQKDLKKIHYKEMSLRELYDAWRNIKEWLKSHESQYGTNNLLNISGGEYDPKEYEAKMEEYKNLEEKHHPQV